MLKPLSPQEFLANVRALMSDEFQIKPRAVATIPFSAVLILRDVGLDEYDTASALALKVREAAKR